MESIHILIIDDKENVRESFRDKLEQKKYIVSCASNAKESLSILTPKTNIKLCIIDYLLPDSNGLELTQKLKGLYKEKLEIIVFTGLDVNIPTKEAIVDAGAFTFIMKPLGDEELFALIRGAISKLSAIDEMVKKIELKHRYQIAFNNLGELAYTKDKNNKVMCANDLFINKYGNNVEGKEESAVLGITIPELNEENGKYLEDKQIIDYDRNEKWFSISAKYSKEMDATIVVLKDIHRRKILSETTELLANADNFNEIINIALQGIVKMGYDRVRYYIYHKREKLDEAYMSMGMERYYELMKEQGIKFDFNGYLVNLDTSKFMGVIFELQRPHHWSFKEIKDIILKREFKYKKGEEREKIENYLNRHNISSEDDIGDWIKDIGFKDARNSKTGEPVDVLWADIPILDGEKRIGTIAVDNYYKAIDGRYTRGDTVNHLRDEWCTNEDMETMAILGKHVALSIKKIELNNRFNSLMNSTKKHSIIGTDLDLNIVDWNIGAESIFGYTKDEALGKKTDELIYIEPMQEQIRTEIVNSRDGFYETELIERRKDGSNVTISFTAHHLEDIYGKEVGTIGIGQEVAEKKSLELKLRRAETFATVGSIASGIAHQIRGPINGIKTWFEYFKMKKIFDIHNPTLNEALRHIELNLNNITETVTAMHKMARGATLPAESVVLYDLVKDCLILVKEKFLNVRVENRISGARDIKIFVERSSIKIVLINLFLNAAEAMAKGGEVLISSQIIDDTVKISITDTGCGIPLEKQINVFKHMFTTKMNGTGTGLMLVYELIERNEGKIEFKSEEGKGTTFHIYLPISKEQK